MRVVGPQRVRRPIDVNRAHAFQPKVRQAPLAGHHLRRLRARTLSASTWRLATIVTPGRSCLPEVQR